MSTISGLLVWSQENLVPLGPIGLFVIAFMESSFFPIFPDIILIPLVLLEPQMGLIYAAITTIGSVLGAVFGYFIGVKGGRPILIKLAGKKNVEKVENYFERYGAWAVGIAGFTPIPYKIFTIASGVFRFNIAKMLFASIISRGARFFIIAVTLMLWGNEILLFIENYFGLASIIAVAAVIFIYFVYKKFFGKREENAGVAQR